MQQSSYHAIIITLVAALTTTGLGYLTDFFEIEFPYVDEIRPLPTGRDLTASSLLTSHGDPTCDEIKEFLKLDLSNKTNSENRLIRHIYEQPLSKQHELAFQMVSLLKEKCGVKIDTFPFNSSD